MHIYSISIVFYLLSEFVVGIEFVDYTRVCEHTPTTFLHWRKVYSKISQQKILNIRKVSILNETQRKYARMTLHSSEQIHILRGP